MPMYDFQCVSCGHQFEEVVSASCETCTCPSCGNEEAQRQVCAPNLKTGAPPFKVTGPPPRRTPLPPKKPIPNRGGCGGGCGGGGGMK